MTKTPPVPKENRSDKGPGEKRRVNPKEDLPATPENPDKQGQQANTKINTTHADLC